MISNRVGIVKNRRRRTSQPTDAPYQIAPEQNKITGIQYITEIATARKSSIKDQQSDKENQLRIIKIRNKYLNRNHSSLKIQPPADCFHVGRVQKPQKLAEISLNIDKIPVQQLRARLKQSLEKYTKISHIPVLQNTISQPANCLTPRKLNYHNHTVKSTASARPESARKSAIDSKLPDEINKKVDRIFEESLMDNVRKQLETDCLLQRLLSVYPVQLAQILSHFDRLEDKYFLKEMCSLIPNTSKDIKKDIGNSVVPGIKKILTSDPMAELKFVSNHSIAMKLKPDNFQSFILDYEKHALRKLSSFQRRLVHYRWFSKQ